MIGYVRDNRAKKNVPENPICSTQDFLAQVCLWVLVKGLMKPGTALWGLTSSLLPRPTDPAVRHIQLGLFLSVLEKNRKSLTPLQMIIFPHTVLWITKSQFLLNTRTSHLWLCARQSTSEVNRSSCRVQHENGLCCGTAIIPQSVLA